ncbi:endonuclease/exonuclease/phosphatase family protein [Lutimonas saemankumensis]|uniref:endonuclease/exonuclease/phosphatase family protein n=1 Tax=Lutimonas saemankumensis TaxID=483016 RepID=UPI001CD7E125|nr:endonuclease/exonuclease/phosphatase family protein [Lutimonas saemankumensis]MCA0933688.1 endonuclease/exonuclease/phosphatase family protein [Lutimonas saemankumensis]
MKSTLKNLFILLVCLFFLLVGFYLWASSPNLSSLTYNETGGYEYTGTQPNDTIHSIMTYNIGYLSGMTNNLPVEKPKSLFDQNLNKVIYELKKSDADIVCFQEIDFDSKRSYYIDQQHEIAKLGYPYFGKNINWDKKYVPFPYYPFSMHFGKILSGQSVLSKFPILEQERIELKRNQNNPFYYDSFYLDRLAQLTKVKIEGRTVVLINVHLEAFDSTTRKDQFYQIKNIYLKYAKKYPTILLGDFNSDINYEDAGINIILKIQNIGCASFDPENFENTYNSEAPSERLDYIFYNKDFIEEIDAMVLSRFETASDHLPLLMKFKFKNQQYASIRQQPNP